MCHNVLLKEISEYSSYRKAQLTYSKCLKAKKYKLAYKIKLKYELFINDDNVDSMLYSIQYANLISKKCS